MVGTAPISAAVMTACTPGHCRAAAASMARMRPCATALRRMTACNSPSQWMSSTKVPRPRRNRGSSRRWIGLPTTALVVRACSSDLIARAPSWIPAALCSLGLQTRGLDDLAPFGPFGLGKGRKLLGHQRRWLGSDVPECGGDIRRLEYPLHLGRNPVDDRPWRAGGTEQALPTGRFISFHGFADGREVGCGRAAFRRRYRKRPDRSGHRMRPGRGHAIERDIDVAAKHAVELF